MRRQTSRKILIIMYSSKSGGLAQRRQRETLRARFSLRAMAKEAFHDLSSMRI